MEGSEFIQGTPLILDLTKPKPAVIHGGKPGIEPLGKLYPEERRAPKSKNECMLSDNLTKDITLKQNVTHSYSENSSGQEETESKLFVKIKGNNFNTELIESLSDHGDDSQAEEYESDDYSSSGTDDYMDDEESSTSNTMKPNLVQEGLDPGSDTELEKTVDKLLGSDLHNKIEKLVKSDIITCNVCGKMFDDKLKYKYHTENHRKKKNHVCDTCGRCFLDAKRLLCHMSSHTGDKLFSCKVCGKKLSQACGINRHMRVHTGEKPYTCGVCKKSFTTRGSVKVHMRLHTGEKPYKCNICGNSFTARSTLWSHEKIHTGERDLECKVCGKHFTLNSTLKKHMLIHDENYTERFACDICGKEYSYRNSMQRHRKTHAMEEEKPFTCEICGNKYTMLSSLRRHNEIHFRGELTKDFNCEYCFKTFAYKSSVVLHMKRTHKLKSDGTPLDSDSSGMFIVTSDTEKSNAVYHDKEEESGFEEDIELCKEPKEKLLKESTNEISRNTESCDNGNNTFLYALDLVKKEMRTIYNKETA